MAYFSATLQLSNVTVMILWVYTRWFCAISLCMVWFDS